MPRPKRDTRYDTIKLPEGVTAIIDELIAESNLGFTSRTDVIKHGVRLLYRQVKG